MKKIVSYIVMFAMLAGIFAPAANMDAAVKLKLAKKSVKVKVKESVKVKYTSAKKPKAVSKNKKIAKAKVKGKNILITGVKKGKTSITVKAAGKTAFIKVTVYSDEADNNAASTANQNGNGTNSSTIDNKNNNGTNSSNTDNKDNNGTNSSTTAKPDEGNPAVPATEAPKGNDDTKATPRPTIDPDDFQKAISEMGTYPVNVNKFSCKTFNSIKDEDSNTFASPLSLYLALAMLVNGADGNTKTEMLMAMGITDLNEFNSKIRELLAGSFDEKVALIIANAAWLGNSFRMAENIEDDFINPVKEYYDCDVKKDVRMDSQDLVDEVNNWADEKTNGMIKEILKDPLSENTAMLLANAIYFLGTWSEPFAEEATFKTDFNGTKGTSTVSMMSQDDVKGKYFKDDNFVGAAIPYGNGTYEMDILMSADTATTAGAVWDSLTVDEQIATLDNFDDMKNTKRLDLLQIPKFELDGDYSDELIQALKDMGMNDAFDCNYADFTKAGYGLFVSKIKQMTKLKVDEKGTEAAAVTVVVVEANALPPQYRTDFIVDRPFVFTIRDSVSGMILFMGEVNNL